MFCLGMVNLEFVKHLNFTTWECVYKFDIIKDKNIPKLQSKEMSSGVSTHNQITPAAPKRTLVLPTSVTSDPGIKLNPTFPHPAASKGRSTYYQLSGMTHRIIVRNARSLAIEIFMSSACECEHKHRASINKAPEPGPNRYKTGPQG